MSHASNGRPAFHFTPRQGWLNDPHGVVFHDGKFHLFHQAIPESVSWSPQISWGHATSTDLMNWTPEPTALQPAPDETGCWTGTLCLPPDGQPLILYTSAREPNLDVADVRVAHPVDGAWHQWANGDRVELPLDAKTRNRIAVFRDPSVRRENDRWRMVVGAGYTNGRPAVLSWVSNDLSTWAFDGELAVGILRNDGPWLGTAWECPHLIRVDGHDVLFVGSWKDGTTGEVLAAVGELQNGRFEGTEWTQITHGGGHYAVTVFFDADSLPCAIFWIRGIADLEAGWAGALSIPYRLSVIDDVLHMRPHPNAMEAFGENGGDPHITLLEVDEIDGFHHNSVDVTSGRHELVVSVGSTHLRIPSVRGKPAETLTVIVDGPVLEVCTGTSIAGAQLPAPSTSTLSPAKIGGVP